MGIVIYNGISSKDFGLEVEKLPGYDFPEKEYEVTHVPGRNGDIYIDKNSYKNISKSYAVSMGSDDGVFVDMAGALADWLHSASGYARLEDSYEPDYFRKAAYLASNNITNIYGKGAKTTIQFDCKPQRFLKSGEREIEFNQSGFILQNPTIYEARPIITVIGTGDITLKIGEQFVRIIDCNGGITIDSTINDAYYANVNKNKNLVIESGFPTLKKGETEITFDGAVESIKIIPNWWRL